MAEAILDVDLLRFERGDWGARQAVVDGVRRSLASGFVYTSSDLNETLLDEAYGLLGRFFALGIASKRSCIAAGSHGQSGYTGPLVETAAGHSLADWKEMLNWSQPPDPDHPLRHRFPHLYPEPLLPEALVPGITEVLQEFHRAIADLQRRFLRVVALAMGCDESFFEEIVSDAPTLTRAIHYPPMAEAPPGGHLWAAPHGDINLITALPRATGPGLEMRVRGEWQPVRPPAGRVIINTGLMLERLSNGLMPAGWHRVVAPEGSCEARLSVVQFCHPRPWTELAPVAACISAAHPQRYAGLRAADALEEVLYRIKLLEPGAANPA
jgi:isopenicillin N synthase-like dioxygenase